MSDVDRDTPDPRLAHTSRPPPQTTPELWQRLDEQDKSNQLAAIARHDLVMGKVERHDQRLASHDQRHDGHDKKLAAHDSLHGDYARSRFPVAPLWMLVVAAWALEITLAWVAIESRR